MPTVELLLAKAGLQLAIKWMEFCMSDNIRNKTIFETKIAKIAKKLNLTFWKNESNVAQRGCLR